MNIKRAAVFLLLFQAVSLFAQELAARYNFQDFTQTPQKIKTLTIEPLFSFGVNGTNIVTGDRRTFVTDTSGSKIISNILAGYSYRVTLAGSYSTTVITNYFGTNVTGLVSASDPEYLSVSANSLVPNIATFAVHATTADSAANATNLNGLPASAYARTNAATADTNGLLNSKEFNRIYVSTIPEYPGHSSQFTPIHGINTWYQFGTDVSETGIVAQVTQMVTNGLRAAGYNTYMLDDGVFDGHDGITGLPKINSTKFPSGWPYLRNFLITNGFKIGIYLNAGADSGEVLYATGIEGHEVTDAQWCITNAISYVKCDGPDSSYNSAGKSVWPLTYSATVGTTNQPGLGKWDQNWSKFITELRKSPYPIFTSCALDDIPRPNMAQMFNSWRMTGTPGTNSLGDSIAGDVAGGNIFLTQMHWVDHGLNWRQWWGPWRHVDLDPIDYGHINTFEGEKTFLALRALFGTSLQFGTLVPNFDTGYTLWNKRLVRHITLWTNQTLFTVANDAGYQAPKSNAVVNGVWQYSRPLGTANSSNQFVLAVNRNYTATNTGAGSASLSQTLSADGLRYTNSFSSGGTNKTYVFYATNSTLYWTNFGYSATQPILVKDIWNGGETISVGSLSLSLYPQGSAAFIVRPSTELSLARKGKVYLSDMPYFSRTNFYISAGGDISLDTQLGHPIAVGRSATEYSKGVGIQTSQRLDYGVLGATRFHATVGENYYKSSAISGSSTVDITFSVLADGAELWNSGSMTKLSFSTNVDLSISGATNLTLLAIATGGTPGSDDFGAWADAYCYFPDLATEATSARNYAGKFRYPLATASLTGSATPTFSGTTTQSPTPFFLQDWIRWACDKSLEISVPALVATNCSTSQMTVWIQATNTQQFTANAVIHYWNESGRIRLTPSLGTWNLTNGINKFTWLNTYTNFANLRSVGFSAGVSTNTVGSMFLVGFEEQPIAE